MPNGFNSIADLITVVDAEIGPFKSGMAEADAIQKRFADNSAMSLADFDRRIAKSGDGVVDYARNKLSTMGPVGETVAGVIGVIQDAIEKADGAIRAAGAGDALDRLYAATTSLGEATQGTLVSALDEMGTNLAETTSDMLGFARATESATDNSNALAKGLDTITKWVGEVKYQVERLGPETSQSFETLEREARLLADTLGVLERLSFGRNVIPGARELFDEQRKGIEAQVSIMEQLAWLDRKSRDVAADQQVRDAIGTTIAQVEALEAKRRFLGQAAVELEIYNMQLKASADLEKAGVTDKEAIARVMGEVADRVRVATAGTEAYNKSVEETKRAEQLAEQRNKAESNILLGSERELANLRARSLALTETAGAAAEAAKIEQLLLQYRQAGIDVDETRMVQIRAIAAATRNQIEANEALADSMQLIEGTGLAVSRTMEGAFRQWTQGAKLDVADMVASILSDLATLVLRKNVLEPLSDSFSSSLSSMFGFGGARAEGGPVTAGMAYLVGERRPEIFVPDRNGTILPDTKALGAGAAPSISVVTHVDARGATSEGEAAFRRALAERDAALPSTIISVMREARERALA